MPSSFFLLADFSNFLSTPGLSDVQLISFVYGKDFILSHMVRRTVNKLRLSDLISCHCGDLLPLCLDFPVVFFYFTDCHFQNHTKRSRPVALLWLVLEVKSMISVLQHCVDNHAPDFLTMLLLLPCQFRVIMKDYYL